MPSFIMSLSASLLFALKIALATLLAWPMLTWLGIEQPVWAVVTIAAVSDPKLAATADLVRDRVSNTLIGCVVALLTVWTVGAHLGSLAAALAVEIIVGSLLALGLAWAFSWRPHRRWRNWRLARQG